MSNEQVKQTFQSDTQLFALKVHAAWTKFENVILWPARWLSNAVSGTPAWQAAERVQLRIVK